MAPQVDRAVIGYIRSCFKKIPNELIRVADHQIAEGKKLWPLPIVLITLFGANGLGSPEIPGRTERHMQNCRSYFHPLLRL
jgi:hypothetical protein